jgi:YfiH family protein
MSVDRVQADWPAPANIVAGTTTRAGGASELPGEPLWLNQVHGATVLRSDDPAFGGDPPDADASISCKANDVIAVKTADCLPVLLCTSAGDEIAAAHCGWRGLAAGVLSNTVAAMTGQPADLIAWLGPAISQAAYEVGDDVREAFVATDAAAAARFEPNDRGRWQADLYGLARLQLSTAGVSQIYGGGFCTFADADRFFSYRRDGTTGRMVSYIYRL